MSTAEEELLVAVASTVEFTVLLMLGESAECRASSFMNEDENLVFKSTDCFSGLGDPARVVRELFGADTFFSYGVP